MKFSDSKIDWKRIYHAMANPKTENGEEYIDVSPAEMAAVNKVCEIWEICAVDTIKDRKALLKADTRYQEWIGKQFDYLKQPKRLTL